MATGVVESQRYVLFVTGPARERLFRRFSALFEGRADVEVRMDRRVAERRHAPSRPDQGERRTVERRKGDRRRARPEWIFPPPEGV